MSSVKSGASGPTVGVIGAARRRRVRPIAGVAITGMLVAIGLPLAAISATAAVVTPGVILNAFPNRDFVMAQGYTPGTAHTVNVVRAGVTVGTSAAVADSAGFVQVNHPAIAPDVANCWDVVTPSIQPGDVIQVLTGTTVVDSMTTDGINLTTPAAFAGGIVTIHGTAPGATAGTRIPEPQLEIRAVAKNTKFAKNQKTSLRANSLGTLDGLVSYDAPLPSTAWTATFTGMNVINQAEPDGLTDGARAVNSQSVAMSILTLQEITNSEKSSLIFKGPALPCTAPAAVGPSKPVMTAATDTGVSATDGLTNNPLPTFGGVPGPTATRIDLFVDGVLNGSTTAVTGGAYSVTPTTPLTAGTHAITVGELAPAVVPGTFALTMGNAPGSVTIDLTSPTLTVTSPLANATGVSTAGNITATFSENVSGATFALTNSATGAAVPATMSSANGVVTLSPTAALAPLTMYTATLTGGITDVAGNLALAVPSWSFTTGGTQVQRYISRVYLDLFNRAPEAAGLVAWTAKLDSGTPRVAVANAITASPEYRSKLITGSYNHYLLRAPEPAGLSAWLAAMNRGITISQMEGGFIGSDEYFAKAGSTNANWVVKLYSDVLGRAASPAEVTFWSSRLDAGLSGRAQVAMGFLLSTERLSTVVEGYYTTLLGRSVDPTGLQTWVKILQAGGRNEAIIGGIIGSAEYFNKV